MPTVPPPTAIGALTIDCDDAEAMGRFYIEGLGVNGTHFITTYE